MTSFDLAHRKVKELCDHFDARRSEVFAPGYQEATARAEYITPLFEALGWDINKYRTSDDLRQRLRAGETRNGSYATAQQAAEDLACGHTFSLPGGIDPSELGVPDELEDWVKIAPET